MIGLAAEASHDVPGAVEDVGVCDDADVPAVAALERGVARAAHIDALACLKAMGTPKYTALLPTMKSEIVKYNARTRAIPDKDKRLDAKGNDTWDFMAWWRAAKDELPALFEGVRLALTYSPNSCPPERVFSILNDTFDDDQESANNRFLSRASTSISTKELRSELEAIALLSGAIVWRQARC